LIQFDYWTGLGGSTQRLHQKNIGMLDEGFNKKNSKLVI